MKIFGLSTEDISAISDFALAIFTLAVIVITWLQYCAFKTSERRAEKAEERLSEHERFTRNATLDTSRAHIFLGPQLVVDFEELNNGEFYGCLLRDMWFVNYGKTPGVLRAFGVHPVIARAGEPLPPEPTWNRIPGAHGDALIQEGKEFKADLHRFRLEPDDFLPMKTGQKVLYLFFHHKYSDIYSCTYTRQLCLQVKLRGQEINGLISAGGSRYNYEYREEPESENN